MVNQRTDTQQFVEDPRSRIYTGQPDFIMKGVTVGQGVVLGAATIIDRHDQFYVSLKVGLELSPLLAGGEVLAGYILEATIDGVHKTFYTEPPTKEDLERILKGFGVSYTMGMLLKQDISYTPDTKGRMISTGGGSPAMGLYITLTFKVEGDDWKWKAL